MIILPALVLVVVVVVFLAAGGSSLLREHDASGMPRTEGVLGGAGPALALVGGAVVVVALGAVAVVGLGLRGGGDHDDGGATAAREAQELTTTTTGATTTTTGPTTTTTTAAAGDGGAVLGPPVQLARPEGDGFAAPPVVVDELAPGTVLRFRVTGFPPDTTGSVAQCVESAGQLRSCRDRFPVRFDGTGTAAFQYLVTTGEGSGCRLGEPACVVAVTAEDGVPAVARTLFVDSAPAPGTVSVAPRRGIDDGEVVTVSVRDFPPGARATAVLCAPPEVSPRRCGRPGPEETFTVGPDGAAEVALPLQSGPVGSGRHDCGRNRGCGIAVVTDGAAVSAAVVPVTFSAGPSASYDPARLAAGLAMAVGLAAAAVHLVRSTDWRAPTEAATPELEAAVLDDV